MEHGGTFESRHNFKRDHSMLLCPVKEPIKRQIAHRSTNQNLRNQRQLMWAMKGTGVLLGPRYRSKQSGGKNPKTADSAESFRFEWGFFLLYICTLISGEILRQSDKISLLKKLVNKSTLRQILVWICQKVDLFTSFFSRLILLDCLQMT